jgi:hypothetical protein
LGARQDLRTWHTRAASAGLANMYFIAPKTSASVNPEIICESGRVAEN